MTSKTIMNKLVEQTVDINIKSCTVPEDKRSKEIQNKIRAFRKRTSGATFVSREFSVAGRSDIIR